MKYYLAPLEGITGYIYRNAYEKTFGDVDKYFTPFLVPNQSRSLKTKELKDVLPENNQGMYVVPQILTNNSEHFNDTAKRLEILGYNEINLNLGCPSGTVVAKDKGSGFLAKTEELDNFLDEIYNGQNMKISIKTRIGKDSADEFYKLLEIYNKYPLEELIIHARTQKDFYKNKPNLEIFQYAMKESIAPVCYNGNIFSKEDNDNFIKEFADTKTIMLARGTISNPGLMTQIKTGKMMEKKTLKSFHDEILNGYIEQLKDQRIVLFKMKEIWGYMIWMFSDHKKYAKAIRKSQTLIEYKIAVTNLFAEQDIVPGASLFKNI